MAISKYVILNEAKRSEEFREIFHWVQHDKVIL
jgi:hypothetical protein